MVTAHPEGEYSSTQDPSLYQILIQLILRISMVIFCWRLLAMRLSTEGVMKILPCAPTIDQIICATIEVMIESSGPMKKFIHAANSEDERTEPLPERPAESPEEPPTEPPQEPPAEPIDLDSIGPSSILLDELRILAFSTNSSNSDQDGELHSDGLRRAVKSGAMSLPEAFAVQKEIEAKPEHIPEDDEPESDDDGPDDMPDNS